MGVSLTWKDVKRRASIRAISQLSKVHAIVVLAITLCKLFFAYAARILTKSGYTDDPFKAIYCPCATALATYVALVFLLTSRQVTFRGSGHSDIQYILWGFINIIATTSAITIFANAICRIYITNLQILFVICAAVLYQLRVRRQRLDVMRSLDREHITAPHMQTVIALSVFHVVVSIGFTIFIALLTRLCYMMWCLIRPSSVITWDAAFALNKILSFIPGIEDYKSKLFGLESATLIVATLWVITLIEAYYELINLHLSHMDHVIANSIEAFPTHGTQKYEDELLLARAFLNYSLGVSMTLNPGTGRFEPTGNAMHVSFTEDPRRCPMVPFIKIPQASTYSVEGKRQRYQVDTLIYRMLVDTRGQMFSSYVEAFIENVVEAEAHIIALTSKRESVGNLRIELNPEANTCNACGNLIDIILGGFLSSTPKIPYKANKAITLALIYTRGLSNWLCIANMLGYTDTTIQQVAKEFVAQCASLSKAISTIRRYSMPIDFANTLDVVANVINIALKQMSVYADAMLYSTFNTDFDTFRLLEKIYKPMVQSTFT